MTEKHLLEMLVADRVREMARGLRNAHATDEERRLGRRLEPAEWPKTEDFIPQAAAEFKTLHTKVMALLTA